MDTALSAGVGTKVRQLNSKRGLQVCTDIFTLNKGYSIGNSDEIYMCMCLKSKSLWHNFKINASGLTWLHHRLQKYSWCTAVFMPQITNEVAFTTAERIFGLFGTNGDKQSQMWEEYLWENGPAIQRHTELEVKTKRCRISRQQREAVILISWALAVANSVDWKPLTACECRWCNTPPISSTLQAQLQMGKPSNPSETHQDGVNTAKVADESSHVRNSWTKYLNGPPSLLTGTDAQHCQTWQMIWEQGWKNIPNNSQNIQIGLSGASLMIYCKFRWNKISKTHILCIKNVGNEWAERCFNKGLEQIQKQDADVT